MPSRSWAEHKFWEAAKHSPSFAKRAGVSRSVAAEFDRADKKAGITGKKKSLPARLGKPKTKRRGG